MRLQPILFGGLLATLLFAVGCGNGPAERAELACDPYAGTDEVLADAQNNIIFLGEIHGTEEGPGAARELVCAALKAGYPVLYGIETDSTQTDALNAALDPPFAKDRMIAAAPYFWRSQDGRSSEAMFSLLEQLSAWRGDGYDVSVFAFDPQIVGPIADGDLNTIRNVGMAGAIDDAVRGFDGAVILLTGNLHARKSDFSFRDIPYVPAASRVTARSVKSFNMSTKGGTAFIQQMVETPDGGSELTSREITLNDNVPEGAEPRSFVFSYPEPELYDGVYVSGPAKASPPMIRDPDTIPD